MGLFNFFNKEKKETLDQGLSKTKESVFSKLTRAVAGKSKEARVQVILECTEHKESGLPGTSRYITVKNRKNTPARMELKKYNPIMKKVTVHKEIK